METSSNNEISQEFLEDCIKIAYVAGYNKSCMERGSMMDKFDNDNAEKFLQENGYYADC